MQLESEVTLLRRQNQQLLNFIKDHANICQSLSESDQFKLLFNEQ